jgi:Amt family ammonium transporter
VVGNILTAFFAQKSIAALDGSTVIPGGWLDHHWPQLIYQLTNSAAGLSYSFVVTVRVPVHLSVISHDYLCSCSEQTLILRTMNLVPGLRLRCAPHVEDDGIDGAEIGEYAYDYVPLHREISPQAANHPNAPAANGGGGGRGGGGGVGMGLQGCEEHEEQYEMQG